MCCIGIHVPVFNCFSNEICHSFLHPLDSMVLVSQFPLWAMTAETQERFVCRRMCCLAVNSFRRPEIADEWCNFTHSSIVSLDTWCQSRNRSNQSWCLMVLTSTINLCFISISFSGCSRRYPVPSQAVPVPVWLDVRQLIPVTKHMVVCTRWKFCTRLWSVRSQAISLLAYSVLISEICNLDQPTWRVRCYAQIWYQPGRQVPPFVWPVQLASLCGKRLCSPVPYN